MTGMLHPRPGPADRTVIVDATTREVTASDSRHPVVRTGRLPWTVPTRWCPRAPGTPSGTTPSTNLTLTTSRG